MNFWWLLWGFFSPCVVLNWLSECSLPEWGLYQCCAPAAHSLSIHFMQKPIHPFIFRTSAPSETRTTTDLHPLAFMLASCSDGDDSNEITFPVVLRVSFSPQDKPVIFRYELKRWRSLQMFGFPLPEALTIVCALSYTSGIWSPAELEHEVHPYMGHCCFKFTCML